MGTKCPASINSSATYGAPGKNSSARSGRVHPGMRPAHGTSALLPRLREQRSNIDRHPQLRQAQTERFDAGNPLCTLARQKRF